MKTVAEIIDLVEEYGKTERNGDTDWHERLAEVEAAIKEREAEMLKALEFAMSGVRYQTRIPGQNDNFCDAVDHARAVLARAKA